MNTSVPIDPLVYLRARFNDRAEADALWFLGHSYSYAQLLNEVDKSLEEISAQGVRKHEIIGLQGDYSLQAVALLLALFFHQNVAALLPVEGPLERLLKEGRVARLAKIVAGDIEWSEGPGGTHQLLDALAHEGQPGFTLCSSGSSGQPKVILHDLHAFLDKFSEARKPLKTLAFLSLDHIAGLDTLFYSLFSGGCLVFPEHRDPDYICALIAREKIEVLPASPSFFRLLLLAKSHHNYDLSSLRYLTYGAEPMSQAVLDLLTEAFPNTRIVQKYGTSEFGSPRSKSRSDGSLWLKLGDANFKTRVIDGILWVKAKSTMRGYLSSSDLQIEDGWICSGDEVEVDGEWLRILGRQSEMINVGGEKVFPAEVEAVIEQVPGVLDVVVSGVPHPFLGQSVSALVRYGDQVNPAELPKLIRQHCRKHLSRYKVPMNVKLTEQDLVTDRNKKRRFSTQ